MHIRLSKNAVIALELKKREAASIAALAVTGTYVVIGLVALAIKFGVGILPTTLALLGAVYGPPIVSALRIRKLYRW